MGIKELIEKQRQLDLYISKEKGLGDPYDRSRYYQKTKLALLVEVGELANASRCFKYWSHKKSESRERLLDEMADCLHFVFRLGLFEIEENKYGYNLLPCNSFEEWEKGLAENECSYDYVVESSIETIFIDLFNSICELDNVFERLLCVAIKLGLQMRELEEAYLRKHEENYKRQVEGY